MGILMLLSILVPSVTSCGSCAEVTQTSLELINQAYEDNDIDYDMRALYLTYSIYNWEALPEKYRSEIPMKDATPIILEIQRNWDLLKPATQEIISQYIQPIESPSKN